MVKDKRKKLGVVLGARPNFIKAAAFFAGAKSHPIFSLVTIHTGQHYNDNMSSIFFEQLGLPTPDYYIENNNHSFDLGGVVGKIKNILLKDNVDAVILFGDVHSTLAGALAAKSIKIPIVHIEAGLRSRDIGMPEEVNRIAVDHMSDLLFFSEKSAGENLSAEHIPENSVFFVGNIMIETLVRFKEDVKESMVLSEMGLNEKDYFVATVHRRENLANKERLRDILSLLTELNTYKKVVLPLHPGTEKIIHTYGLSQFLKDITFTVPMGYFDFLRLVDCSAGVVTDSGGVQEETTFLSVPCCTLRSSTERPATVDFGTNRLFGESKVNVTDLVSHLMKMNERKPGPIPLWDGGVSERIFQTLNNYF